MSSTSHRFTRLAQACYLAMLGWQLFWRVPGPGSGWPGWVVFGITLGLLLWPLRGIMAGNSKAMIWGGYLVVVYFVIGVAEAWDAPPIAWLMPALGVAYVCTATIALRSGPKAP